MKARFLMLGLALVVGHLPLDAQNSGGLTQSEAEQLLYRVEGSLRKTTGLPPRTRQDRPNTPITKAQVLNEFMRIYQAGQPKFRVTPRPYRIVPKILAQIKDPTAQNSARILALNGFLGPVGPLVMEPDAPVNAADYGRALGLFVSQFVRLTSQPDPRWTPSLQGLGD